MRKIRHELLPHHLQSPQLRQIMKYHHHSASLLISLHYRGHVDGKRLRLPALTPWYLHLQPSHSSHRINFLYRAIHLNQPRRFHDRPSPWHILHIKHSQKLPVC